MGQLFGATNARGEYVTENPVTPQDFLATIYRHFGVDPHHHIVDQTGRPIPVLQLGEAIAGLG